MRGDRGDTLVELLVAVSIVGIAVVPLIGTLALSLSGAAEHRNLATIDTVLRSFVETAKSELQITGSSSTFSDSNTTYPLLSLANPSSGPAGTAVTVFGTGFHTNVAVANFTVNIGLSVLTTANNGISTSQSQGNSDTNGNMQVTFIVPTGLSPNTPQQIEVSDGSGTSVFSMAGTGFTVTTGQSPVTTSPLHGYTMGIPPSTATPPGIESWNAAAGSWSTSPVTGSGLQLITLKAAAPGGTSDTLSFVLRNQADDPTPVPTPQLTVVASAVPLPGTLTFTATVQPSALNPTPTGTISWSIGTTPVVSTPTCTSTTPLVAGTGNSATATCSLSLTSASLVGTYTAKASYSGDSYNTAATGSGFVIETATPTVSVSFSSPTPAAGQTGTFTATIAPPASGDPAPSGNVTWSFSGLSVPPNASCAATGLPSGGTGSQTATCSFTALVGVWSYTAMASYTGDTNYNPQSGSDAVSYTVSSSTTFTCGSNSFNLPASSTVNYTLIGAGGATGSNGSGSAPNSGGVGGAGAQITGTLQNTTGSAIGLTINVGCVSVGTTGTAYANGGNGGTGSGNQGAGGAGGGTSSIEITSSSTNLVVAGGGGGGGGGQKGSNGAVGSNSTGTSSPITSKAGGSGASKSGAGGGGGGVNTAAAAGSSSTSSAGAGLSFVGNSGMTIGGITITANTPTSAGNGNANGSATL